MEKNTPRSFPDRRPAPGPIAQAEVNRLQEEVERLAAALKSEQGEVGKLIGRLAERSAADIDELGAGIRNTAIEHVAMLIDKKIADYDADNASTDPDTGTREYPGDGEEWVGQMEELAEEVRAFKGVAAPAADDPMPKRTAFIAWCKTKHLDTDVDKDAWGKQIFKHSHIQAMWEAWFSAPSVYVAAPAAGVQAAPDGLIDLLNAIKPNYGDVGTRDIEVTAQRKRIEDAIAILSAPALSERAPSSRRPDLSKFATLDDYEAALAVHEGATEATEARSVGDDPEFSRLLNAYLCDLKAYGFDSYTRANQEFIGYIDSLLSAARRGAPNWQLMATAPLDGSEVILAVEARAGMRGKQLVRHYMPGGHCIEDHPPIESGWYFWNGCRFDKAAKPIAWMALPVIAGQSGKDGEPT